jgi:hypothetical protein
MLSGLLLIVFNGITDALIPLFAIGAFLAFTMSQAGMVAHGWRRRHEAGARHRLLLNALGTLATGVTTLVILVAKLREDAWISLLIIGLMLLVFSGTRRHHAFIARVTSTNASLELGPARPPLAVVPMRRWDAVSLKAVRRVLAERFGGGGAAGSKGVVGAARVAQQAPRHVTLRAGSTTGSIPSVQLPMTTGALVEVGVRRSDRRRGVVPTVWCQTIPWPVSLYQNAHSFPYACTKE